MASSARIRAKAMRAVIGGLIAIALGPRSIAASKPAPTPEETAARDRLAKILAKFDETQTLTRTLTATFTERKDLGLLKDPVVAKGRFFYTKPNDVLWQYTDPDPRYFLINKDELLSYFPRKRKAERVSISMYHDRLLKVLAIGQPSETLRKYYNIHLEETGNTLDGTWLLVLEPRTRIVKKRISELRLWVSQDRSLPIQMQWREPDGDSTTITFEDVRFNPDIQASVYKLDIPKDVEIHKGFSGFAPGKEKEQG